MSVYASLCHEEDGDQLDVAYSVIGDNVRIIIWKDEDGNTAEVRLEKEELKHFIKLLKIAKKRTFRGL